MTQFVPCPPPIFLTPPKKNAGAATRSYAANLAENLAQSDNSGQVDMVYLDFSKAFDSVSHELLIHKLSSFGFHSDLIRWFRAYLTGRHQRVVVDGTYSDWLPVVSGVPQGSILGPLLFVLYINDLPSVDKNTKVALFADDAKCFLNIDSLGDCQLLQNDLNALVDWSSTWELNFHPSKCQVILVTRKRNPFNFDYFMNNTRLSSVKSIKDLGIEISSKLDWNTHINNVVKKCNRKLGLIKHTVGFNAPVNVTKALYLALIRSDLEFGSCLWSGTSRHNVECLEGVQRRATKFIMHFPDLDYREHLYQFNLLPLTLRREQLDLSLFFKCISGAYDLDINRYVKFCNSGSGQGHPTTRSATDPLLKVPFCRTEAFKSSFFNRIVSLWNQLPPILGLLFLFLFLKLMRFFFFKSKFDSNFEANSTCTWFSSCNCTMCRCT